MLATSTLLAGLLAGWGVALPLGAIGTLIVNLGARSGLRPAAAAAAGVATADGLYAALAAAFGAAVAETLEPAQDAVRIISGLVLLGVAVLLLRVAFRPPDEDRPSERPVHHTYLRFLALTAVNPATAAYFAALVIGLPAVAESDTAAKVVFAAAAFAASLSWQLALAAGGAALHRLPGHARTITSVAGALLVAAFAVRTLAG